MGAGKSSDFTTSGYQPAGIYGWRKQCLYAAILFLTIVVVMNLALTVWIIRVLNINIRNKNLVASGYQPAGIYGWRKQCLYAAILFLTIVVVMNLALTVWIIRVLNINIKGLHMGTVQIQDEGVVVDGRASIHGTLHARQIQQLGDRGLTINGRNRVTVAAKEDDKISSKINLYRNKIEATCDSFEIRDPSGKSRFKVTEKGVRYGVDEVTCNGKAVFNASVETPNILGPYKGSLKLESVSSSILLAGMYGVSIEAPEGGIEMEATHDIIFQSDKEILMNGTNLYLKNIPASTPTTGGGAQYSDVYQLCMCQNGKLFLAPPAGRCVTDKTTCS